MTAVRTRQWALRLCLNKQHNGPHFAKKKREKICGLDADTARKIMRLVADYTMGNTVIMPTTGRYSNTWTMPFVSNQIFYAG